MTARRSRKLAVSSVNPTVTTPRRVATRTPRLRAEVGASRPELRVDSWFVGLDQSWSDFGIVAFNAQTEEHRDWRVKVGPTENARRLLKMQAEITRVLGELPGEPVSFAMEGFNRGARNGREEAGALWACTLLALINVYGDTAVTHPWVIAPSTLKKFVTGSGTSKGKNVMLLATYKKWGVEFDNDNLCDAYGLARLAAALTSGASELAYERDVVASVLKRSTPWQPSERFAQDAGSGRRSKTSR